MNIILNRATLVSGVSIQCGISRQDSEKILDSMLKNISEFINSGEVLKLKSFGEFKPGSISPGNDLSRKIEFKSSKKLNNKINKIYENLSPARKVYDKNKTDNIYDEFGITDFIQSEVFEEEVINQSEDNAISEVLMVEENSFNKDEIPEKRLISDKLIELHNEIVNPDKKPDKKNLWG